MYAVRNVQYLQEYCVFSPVFREVFNLFSFTNDQRKQFHLTITFWVIFSIDLTPNGILFSAKSNSKVTQNLANVSTPFACLRNKFASFVSPSYTMDTYAPLRALLQKYNIFL